MGTLVFTEIPDPHVTSTVAADELALVWMDDYIVDRDAVAVVALHVAGPSIPNLYCAIFGAGDHPFSFAMESDSSDVAGVSLEGKYSRWVGAFDIVELDSVMSGSSQEALVGRYTQAVDL